jgi:hypothetical protein
LFCAGVADGGAQESAAADVHQGVIWSSEQAPSGVPGALPDKLENGVRTVKI